MRKFLEIGDNDYVNIDHIVNIYIRDLGDAFAFPFKIMIKIANIKNEWGFAMFSTEEEAHEALENLIIKIDEMQE